MSRRNNEFKIGVTVLSFSVVIVWLIITFGKQSLPHFAEEYSIYVNFSGVSGIDKNTPVNRNGVKIGRVDSIESIDEPEKSYVKVKLMIRKDRQIFSNDECRISSGLIGMGSNSYLEIVKRSDLDKDTSVLPLGDGESIPGVTPPNIMQSLSNMESKFNSAVQNFNDTAQKVGQFVDTVNTVVGTPESATENHERILAMLTKSGDMIERVDELVTNINQLFGDDKLRADLQKTATQLPDIMESLAKDLPVITETLAKDLPAISQVFADKVPSTLEQVRITAENLETLTNEARVALNSITATVDIARTNLDNFETFTTALNDDGPAILKSVRQASLKLDGVFNDITMLTNALRNPDGSLGQLVNNPELYQNVQKTIANAEEITASLKPILSDLRIFTDKISRDPGGTIGVRGAISPGAPFKGLPSNLSRSKDRGKTQNRFEPEFDSQVILLGSEDLWYDQPRGSLGRASIVPQWSPQRNPKTPTGTVVYENTHPGFRTEIRSRNIFKNFRWDFWNKNKPQEIVTEYYTVPEQPQTGEVQAMEPRRLPKTARNLSRPQQENLNPIVQVQYRVSQQEIPHQNVTQMGSPYMEDFANSMQMSNPGQIYGQNFEGMIHQGQDFHEGTIHNLQDELFHGGQNFNGNAVYGGNSFGMPFGSGRASSFFEEMKIRGIIFRENIKSFFYGLRGKFGGSNWFDAVETNPDGLFSYLRGNGGGTTGLPWGKHDGYPVSSGSPSYAAHPYNSGYLGDGETPVLDFSMSQSMPQTVSGQFMSQGNIVQHGDFVPGGSWNGSVSPETMFHSPSYFNGSNLRTIIPDAGNFPNGDTITNGTVTEPPYTPATPPGQPQRAPNVRPKVAPAPNVDAPQNQKMHGSEAPQSNEAPAEGGNFSGANPPVTSPFDLQDIPATLLELSPPDAGDGQDALDTESDDGVSRLPLNGWGKTFPTKNRGYIIELETDVQQIPQVASTEPAKPEIRLSFTAPQRPASVVSQASLQTPKPLDTIEETQPAPKKSPVQPQYGSVRRGL